MEELPLAALVIVVGVLGFVVSIRIGILLGLRIDRALEARAATDEPAKDEELDHDE